jgi:hypothetical protein
VPFRAVSLDDPAGLREMLEPCSVVAACAGPFSLYGEPLVAAAVQTDTHYLDTTGEQGFMRTVFEHYGERGREAGVALVPGRDAPRSPTAGAGASPLRSTSNGCCAIPPASRSRCRATSRRSGCAPCSTGWSYRRVLAALAGVGVSTEVEPFPASAAR